MKVFKYCLILCFVWIALGVVSLPLLINWFRSVTEIKTFESNKFQLKVDPEKTNLVYIGFLSDDYSESDFSDSIVHASWYDTNLSDGVLVKKNSSSIIGFSDKKFGNVTGQSIAEIVATKAGTLDIEVRGGRSKIFLTSAGFWEIFPKVFAMAIFAAAVCAGISFVIYNFFFRVKQSGVIRS